MPYGRISVSLFLNWLPEFISGIKFQLRTGLICLTNKNPLLAAFFSLPSLLSLLPYWFFLVLLPK